MAITTDMWTSKAMDGYITLTCHCIDENWKLRTFLPATAGFVEHHTGKNIGKCLMDVTVTVNENR